LLASYIAWILIVSGIATAAGGFAACVFVRLVLQFVFGVKSADLATIFLVRHWGALLFVVCVRVGLNQLRQQSLPFLHQWETLADEHLRRDLTTVGNI
jgi:hypothetical protein